MKECEQVRVLYYCHSVGQQGLRMFSFPEMESKPVLSRVPPEVEAPGKGFSVLNSCPPIRFFSSLVVLITVVLISKVCVFLKLTSSVYSFPTYIHYNEHVGVFLTDNLLVFEWYVFLLSEYLVGSAYFRQGQACSWW